MNLRRCLIAPAVIFFVLLSMAGTAAAQSLLLEDIDWVIDDGGDGIVSAGDTITFDFLVVNNYPSFDVVDVSVNPGKAGIIMDPPIEVLEESGGQGTIAGVYTITPADVVAGQVTLVAPYAFGTESDCEVDCAVQSPPAPDEIVTWDNPVADLTVSKSDSADPIDDGDELTYTIQVQNLGPDQAQDVYVEDQLPDGVSLLSVSGCVEFSGTTCYFGNIESGGTREYSITVLVGQGVSGVLSNQACAYQYLGEQLDPNPNNDCDIEETTIDPGGADLSIRKADSVDPVAPGAEFDYIIQVINRGPEDALNVSVSDSLPSEVSFVASTCSSGSAADCFIGSLAAGATFAYQVTVAVNDDASGSILNTASVSADTFDPNTRSNKSSETTTIRPAEEGADLVIAKSVSPVGAVEVGSELVYTINVSNAGPGTATNVVATDDLPAGVSLVSSSCSAASSCNLGTLAPGASSEPWVITVVVDEGAGPTLTNTAHVTSDAQDPDPGNNSASASNTVNQAPQFEATFTVRKDFSDDSPDAVQLALSCTDAVVDQSPKSATEAAPAVFMLTEVGPDNRCTATEPQVPDAYTADASGCASIAVAPESSPSCTIVNTRLPDETTITVKVSLNDPDAQVEVTLSCTDATIEDDTQPASNDSPAVFKLSNVGPENTCKADVTGAPAGSLTDASSCDGLTVAEGEQVECQINNIDLPDVDLPAGSNPLVILDTIVETCPRGTNVGGFQELCNGLIGGLLGGSDVTGALSEVTPDDAASVRSSGMQTTNVQVSAVDGRLGTLRGGGGAGFSASGFSMAVGDFAMSGSLLKNFLTAFDQNAPDFMQANAGQDDAGYLDEFGRWGIWVSGRLVFGAKDRTTNQIDYDFDTAGLTFGMDYRFSDELVVGIAAGYADTSTDLGVDDGDVDTRGYSMSLYGTWFQADRFYLAGSLGYGSNDYDQRRILRYNLGPNSANSVMNVEQTLGADYGGSQYSATLGGGWDFNKDGWTFGPTLRVAYVTVDVDAYNETLFGSNVNFGSNAVGWAVHIEEQSYSSLQPSVGFEFTKAVSRGWGVMIPQGYVDIVSELEDGPKVITGRFLGDTLSGNNFSLLTDDFEETFARAGLGLGFILPNNKSAFITVDADIGRELLTVYYINAGFRWQF